MDRRQACLGMFGLRNTTSSKATPLSAADRRPVLRHNSGRKIRTLAVSHSRQVLYRSRSSHCRREKPFLTFRPRKSGVDNQQRKRKQYAIVTSCPGVFCTSPMVSTAVFDTLAAIVLLAVALIGSYTPVLLHNWGKRSGAPAGRSLAYVLGNMLSAGVMISAGFVHLLGAAIKELNPSSIFPLAPFLCGFGFILTLLADHAAETLSARTGWSSPACNAHNSSAQAVNLTSAGSVEGTLLCRVVVDSLPADAGKRSPQNESPSRDPLDKHSFQVDSAHQLPTGNGVGHQQQSRPAMGGSPHRRAVKPEQIALDAHSSDTEPLVGSQAVSSSGLENREAPRPLPRSISGGSTGRGVEALAATLSVQEKKQVSFVTAVLMAVALCFHSVLEGMAMGAQSSIVDTIHIFIAIVAHKGLAAYALGSSVVDSGASQRRFWAVISAFSLATPAGIALGRIVASFSDSGPAAGLSAVASGTFLYVAFMEVIPKEMQTTEHGFSKLGMLCLGFGAMSLLAIWA